eukprot:4771842-Pyramimonas_sp.AAC.1
MRNIPWACLMRAVGLGREWGDERQTKRQSTAARIQGLSGLGSWRGQTATHGAECRDDTVSTAPTSSGDGRPGKHHAR